MGTWKLNPGFRPKVNDRVLSLLDGIGRNVAGNARRIVPVDTGKLKASIDYQVDPLKRVVTIYSDVEYAAYVELGTSRMAAQPYLRPAVMMLRHMQGVDMSTLSVNYMGGRTAHAATKRSHIDKIARIESRVAANAAKRKARRRMP